MPAAQAMKHSVRIYLLLLCLACAAGQARAQNFGTVDRGRGQYGGPGGIGSIGANPFDPNNPANNPYGEGYDQDGNPLPPPDTVPPRERKPLESYFFDDSVRSRKVFSWTVDMYTNNVRMRELDTTLAGFEVDYPFMRDGVGAAYLGNLGAAAVPLDYYDRPRGNDFTFADPYYAYLYTPENAPFYNGKTPFTVLAYQTAGQKRRAEEIFKMVHSQNISPSTSFNVTYHNYGTKGIYENQQARTKNLSLGFAHTGRRYSVHAGYLFNHVNLFENGGIISDWHLTDTAYELPENIPVRLTDARNIIKNNSYYLVQSLGFPLVRMTDNDFSMAGLPAFYVGHSFRYERWFKRYTDTRAGSGDYYGHWYVDPQATRDSIFESLLSNRVFVQLQPWDREAAVAVVDAGIGLDNHHYYQFSLDRYLNGSHGNQHRNDFYAYGSVGGKFRRYVDWSGRVRFSIGGFRAGDLEAGAAVSFSAYIRGKPVTLAGRFDYERVSPSWWSENWFSNHYAWDNSFGKQNRTRFEATLSAPHWNAEVRVQQSLLNDEVYYGADRVPEQSGDVVSVTAVYARKDFRIAGLHLDNRVLLQWSSNQKVAPVPQVSLFLSYYYEFWVVRDVLRWAIGLDMRYNTLYYAPGYDPAIGRFYNQREKRIGNYPWMDAFLTMKWKRMRIMLKFAHVNDDLFGERRYFQVLHYPLNKRIFKMGISWSFYD